MVIDSHCHLHDPAYANLGETLRVALTHDVWGVIAVGVDADSNAYNLSAATAFPKAVWPCLGFHPDRPDLDDAAFERVLAQLSEHHARLVGLGEVGLPWYALEGHGEAATLMTRGRARLDRLLGVAVRYDLPVALHAPHGAAVGAFEALKRHGIERAVFHWHKAPAEVTRAIWCPSDPRSCIASGIASWWPPSSSSRCSWRVTGRGRIAASSKAWRRARGSSAVWPRRSRRSSRCPSTM